MSFGNEVTVTGNAARDPELRWTAAGTGVCHLGVAWNKRDKDGNETAHFFDVTCFGSLAENVAASVVKGTRVVVAGELRQSSWETQDGDKRSKVEIVADECSPSLRWASCEVVRNERVGAQKLARSKQDRTLDEEPF